MSETLATDLALEGTRSGMHRHVPGQIVMSVEHFTADFTSECFGRSIASLSANRTGFRTHRGQGRRLSVFQPHKATSGNKDSRTRVPVIAASR